MSNILIPKRHEIHLSQPQLEAFHSKAPSIAAVAGFGSGKTEFALFRCFSTLFQYPGIDMCYLAPTFPLIRDIWYPKVRNFLESKGIQYKINKSDNIIYVRGYGCIYCRTMDNPDRIVGFDCGDIFCDELDILPIDKALNVWRKVKARARQKFPDGKRNQAYVTTTPEGFKATYQLFKKSPIKGSHLIQMSTLSNAHNLPEDYIDELRANYPPNLIDAYINGNFVNLTSDTVYPYFDRNIHNCSDFVEESEPLDIGMDFNVGNMSAVVFKPHKAGVVNSNIIGIVARIHKVKAVAEVVGLKDTPAMIKVLKDRYKGHRLTIYPDATGVKTSTSGGASLSDIKLLKNAGFQVRAKPTNPAVKDRVITVNQFFNKQRLDINVDLCPETVESIEAQVYDKNGKPDKLNGFDHLPDALGYRLAYSWLVGKPAIDYVGAMASNG